MPEVSNRPTILLAGRGEPMQASLGETLRRSGASIAQCGTGELESAVRVYAPDLVVLLGDGAVNGGERVLRDLATTSVTAVLPVAVISNEPTMDEKSNQFRSGSIAVIPRAAGAEEIAHHLLRLCAEIPTRPGSASGHIDVEQVDTLVSIVSRDSRNGILSFESENDDKSDAQSPPLVIRPDQNRDGIQAAVDKIKDSYPPNTRLRFEFHESVGDRVDTLDEVVPTAGTDLGVLRGVRLAVMDADDWRAEHICEQLVSMGIRAAAADVSPGVLTRLREVDPQVIIVDSRAVSGVGFSIVRAIRRDPFLQWASLLVVKWEDLATDGEEPDLRKLAARVDPLVAQDNDIKTRMHDERDFDTRLELLGPSRLLRAVGSEPGVRQVTCAGRDQSIRIDIADNSVVGAYLTPTNERLKPLQGIEALAPLWDIKSARVSVRERDLPSIANIMMPVDEVLGQVARQIGNTDDLSDVAVDAPTDPPQSRSVADCETLPPEADDSPATVGFNSAQTIPPVQRVSVGRVDTQRIQLPVGAAFEAGSTMRYRDHSVPELPIALGARAVAPTTQDSPAPTGALESVPPMANQSPELATILEGATGEISTQQADPEQTVNRPARFALIAACLVIAFAALYWTATSNGRTETEQALRVVVPNLTPREPARISSELNSRAPSAKRLPPIQFEVDDSVALLVPDADLPNDGAEASAVLVERAKPMLQRGKFAIAKATLDRALELHADNPKAVSLLAELFVHARDAEKALSWANKAIALRPNEGSNHVWLGDAHQLLGMRTKAQRIWRNALKAHPDNDVLRLRLGSGTAE